MASSVPFCAGIAGCVLFLKWTSHVKTVGSFFVYLIPLQQRLNLLVLDAGVSPSKQLFLSPGT
jgi:hypothetical protein